MISADDVAEILEIIDESPLDELRLKTDRYHLLLRRQVDGQWTQEKQELGKVQLTELSDPSPENKTPEKNQAKVKDSTSEHFVDIPTPLPGTFYRAPKPGEAPFVEIGDKVEENTVVAIIETMKLMNSIMAKTRGTVVEICFENAEFADKDTILMRVEPDR